MRPHETLKIYKKKNVFPQVKIRTFSSQTNVYRYFRKNGGISWGRRKGENCDSTKVAAFQCQEVQDGDCCLIPLTLFGFTGVKKCNNFFSIFLKNAWIHRGSNRPFSRTFFLIFSSPGSGHFIKKPKAIGLIGITTVSVEDTNTAELVQGGQ
jgi:hypothetical protein